MSELDKQIPFRHFDCWFCKRHFKASNSIEERDQEHVDNFNAPVPNDAVKVCDECYEKVMSSMALQRSR